MKRFETPILKLEKFDLINIVTTSGETPVEPEEKQKAVDLAAADLVNTEKVFTITL